MLSSRKIGLVGLLGIAALVPPAWAGGSRGEFVIRVQVVDACNAACAQGEAQPASIPTDAAAMRTETFVNPETGTTRLYYVF